MEKMVEVERPRKEPGTHESYHGCLRAAWCGAALTDPSHGVHSLSISRLVVSSL